MAQIKEHMRGVGKGGDPVGTVDKVEGARIKLTKKDGPERHKDHHHHIDRKVVGAVEGDIVGGARLVAGGDSWFDANSAILAKFYMM